MIAIGRIVFSFERPEETTLDLWRHLLEDKMKRTKPPKHEDPPPAPPPIVPPSAVAELQELAVELDKKTVPLELLLRPSSAFQLCALIQLSLRHPGTGESLRDVGTRFCAGVRTYFDGCPTIQRAIDDGFRPDVH